MKILAINGSSRSNSNSSIILQSIAIPIEIMTLAHLPLYNPDLESNLPPEVVALKQKIEQADAILFVTPEHNYSIPSALKNAIDWASRPYGQNSWNNKPAAIISSSPGMLGGIKAQYHLRQIGVFLNLHFLNQPEVVISSVTDKIKDGKIVDQKTLDKIGELLQALVVWTNRLDSNHT